MNVAIIVHGKLPGRVGGSALIGCGIFAKHVGASAMSSDGEQIIGMTLRKLTIDLLGGDCHSDHAAETAIGRFRESPRGDASCIVLDPLGRFERADNSTYLGCAYRNSEMDRPQVSLQKRE